MIIIVYFRFLSLHVGILGLGMLDRFELIAFDSTLSWFIMFESLIVYSLVWILALFMPHFMGPDSCLGMCAKGTFYQDLVLRCHTSCQVPCLCCFVCFLWDATHA